MKICILFLLFVFTKTNAQEPCGTNATPEVLSWWDARAQILSDIAHKGTQAYTVPVHVHIVGNDNGGGYFSDANAYEIICGLNQRFAPMQISFFLEDSVTHINNTNYTNPSLPLASQMMNAYNRPRACNIYMVPQLTGLCGYAYFPAQGPAQGRGGILLKNACSLPGNSDPTHEMGHYFSLLHTFQDWNTSNAELVNGSNCATKGDRFCDTRADWQDYRWNCPYTGVHYDANNDLYQPDSSLYMGYSNTPCPSRFSAQQQAAIIYSRSNDRPYLDSVFIPSYPALTNASLLLPADGAPAVPSGANAVFKWNRVPGATAYNLRIKLPAALFANSVINIIVHDTFYAVNGLTPGTAYEWRVMPVNYVQTCISPDAPGLQTRSFTVVFANSVADVGGNIEALRIFPNPAAAGEGIHITIKLRKGEDVRLQVIGADGRIVFRETVIAASGETRFDIPAESFPPGIYAIRLSSAGFDIVRRIIIAE